MVLDWFVPWHFSLTEEAFIAFLYEVKSKWTFKRCWGTVRFRTKNGHFLLYADHYKIVHLFAFEKKISLGNLQNPSFAVKLGHTTAILRKVLPCFCPHVHCLGIHLQQILRFAPEESALWWAKSPFRFRSKMVARPRCISSQQNYLKFAEINQVKIKRY